MIPVLLQAFSIMWIMQNDGKPSLYFLPRFQFHLFPGNAIGCATGCVPSDKEERVILLYERGIWLLVGAFQYAFCPDFSFCPDTLQFLDLPVGSNMLRQTGSSQTLNNVRTFTHIDAVDFLNGYTQTRNMLRYL